MPTVGTQRVFEIKVVTRFLNQECNNIFHFIQESGGLSFPVNAVTALTNFYNENVNTGSPPDWISLVSENVLFARLDFIEFENPDLFGSIAPGDFGGVSTTGNHNSTSWEGVSLRLQPTSRVVRPGRKNFVGLTETFVSDNNLTSAHQADWATAVVPLYQNVLVNSFEAVVPIILGKRYDKPWNDPTRVLLPLAQWEYAEISAIEVRGQRRPQKSRLPGVGI